MEYVRFFGLDVHDSNIGVFWITSSLNEQIKMGNCVEMAQEYLNIDRVFASKDMNSI